MIGWKRDNKHKYDTHDKDRQNKGEHAIITINTTSRLCSKYFTHTRGEQTRSQNAIYRVTFPEELHQRMAYVWSLYHTAIISIIKQ